MCIYRKTVGVNCPCSNQKIWNTRICGLWKKHNAFAIAHSPSVKHEAGQHIYEAGSIETLIRIVDENGDFTIIPEMHLDFLSEAQRKNVRKIEGNYLSQRRISLYIRKDFVKERMLNTIIDSMKEFMPAQMLSEGIRKYDIRLWNAWSRSILTVAESNG